jgi:thiol-disulfide isomerase/thioredoxin
LSSLTRFVPGSLLLLAMLGGCDRQSGKDAQQAASSAAPAAAANATPATGTFDRSHKGSHLPDLSFTDTKGKVVRLATLSGKPLLVNLWATWCAPCVAELPTLDALAGAKGEGLRVVAVSQDLGDDDKAGGGKVKAFWERKGFQHIQTLLDPKAEASNQYQVASLPTTIYYDAQGREVWRLTGGHDWASKETDKLLAEAGS